jgi:hypothetical protein
MTEAQRALAITALAHDNAVFRQMTTSWVPSIILKSQKPLSIAEVNSRVDTLK